MRGSIAIHWTKTISLALLLALQVRSGTPQSPPAGSPATDYARAESLVRDHQWEEGLKAVDRVLAREPRNLKALNLAGIACSGKGDSARADRYFEQALKIDPHFVPALKNLSLSEFNAHQDALAEKHFLAAQQQLPDDPILTVYLGEIAYNQQRYGIAAERLERAMPFVSQHAALAAHLAVSLVRSGQKQAGLDLLSHAPPSELDPHAQLALGLALAGADSNEAAVPYLAEAFRHDPDSYDAGFDLALACVRAKQFATAIATLQELIGRDHNSSELENLLAEAFAASGDPADAFDAYRKAIALDPSDENNYLDFASLCMDRRAFEDALKVVNSGLRARPSSDRLIFMRGLIEAAEDNYDLAEKDFQQASQLNPQHDLGAVGLGAAYLQHGNSAEALQVTRAELRRKPDDANLLYLLGEGLLAAGAAPGQAAYSEAQAALEKSVQQNPALCLPHIALGTIYQREERYREAAVQFEAARAIDPSENSAYSHLAVAYRHLGEPEKAKEVLSALQALLAQQRSGARIPTIASTNQDRK
jgi:tetratricopeptide (TPR) repeat protein